MRSTGYILIGHILRINDSIRIVIKTRKNDKSDEKKITPNDNGACSLLSLCLRAEDLEALGVLKGTVYVEGKGKTFPARTLTYLTGAREVIFSDDSDMTD